MAGARTEVRIEGTDFQPLVRMSYRAAERSRVDTAFGAWLGEHNLEQVSYVDSTALSAVVPATVPPGSYALSVRAPDGQSGLLEGAFTVLPAAHADGGAVDGPPQVDGGGRDSSTGDTGLVDGSAADTAAGDGGEAEGGGGDGATPDSSGPDAPPADAGPPDSVRPESAQPDAPQPDAWRPDAWQPDAWQPDAWQPDTWQPDTWQPDTWQPDTWQPDLWQPDLWQPDTSSCAPDPPWWDPAYGFRAALGVDEAVAGSVPAGYSLVAVLDTQALILSGQLLASGDDLRVVRTVGAAHQELDRHLVDLDTDHTGVWFKAQEAIDGSDTSYLLYYGNPGAGAAPARWSDSMGAGATPSAVYLAADDFEDDTVGQPPDGWEGAGDYTVQSDSGSQVLRVVGTGSNRADYFFAGDFAWTDVVVQGNLRVVDWTGTYYGLFTRVESGNNFDTLWWGYYTSSRAQAYELTIANVNAEALAGGSMVASYSVASAGSTWHVLRVALSGRDADLYLDGALRGTHTLPSSSMQAGRVGLCAGYTVSEAYWDDIVVRLYVDPEPTVTVGSEEVACP